MSRSQLYLIRPAPDLLQRTIHDFLTAKASRSAATVAFYRHSLTRFEQFCSDWPPTPGICQAWVLELRRAGLSDATIHSYQGGLGVFLRWCVAQRLLASNPLAEIDRPNAPHNIPRAVPQSILKILFATIEQAGQDGNLLGLRDHALFRLIYDGGLRASEAAGLRVQDLDLDDHAAVVRGKGSRQRVVFFGHRARQAVHVWLPLLHPGCGWVFVSNQVSAGFRPLTRNGINQALHRWCDRAGLARFRVHDLRHSYARHALRAGIDVEMVSRQLGHHDPAFTLRIYGRSEDRDRRRAHLEMAPGDHLE